MSYRSIGSIIMSIRFLSSGMTGELEKKRQRLKRFLCYNINYRKSLSIMFIGCLENLWALRLSLVLPGHYSWFLILWFQDSFSISFWLLFIYLDLQTIRYGTTSHKVLYISISSPSNLPSRCSKESQEKREVKTSETEIPITQIKALD